MQSHQSKPSFAFVSASWLALLIGMLTYTIGIWNSKMTVNEKGFYFVILMYGLFSSVSLQKTVRDQLEGLFVTGIYVGLCWFSVGLNLLLLLIGLWNSELTMIERGFYGLAYVLSLYAAVAVQKNIRDIRLAELDELPFSPNKKDTIE
jgi:uncharacterized membrane protein YiaA